MFTYILLSNKINHIFQEKKINSLLSLNSDDFITWISTERQLEITGNVPTAILPKNVKPVFL